MSKSNLETKSIEEKVEMSSPAEKAKEVVLSHSEKKKLRRAQIENVGALFLDPKYKKKGFRQRLVNIMEGNVHKRELEGYRPIIAQDGDGVGNGSVNTAHGLGGSYLEVEVGRKNSQKAIWMEIAEEDALILDEIRDDKAREQAQMLYKSDIPQDVRVGKVSTED